MIAKEIDRKNDRLRPCAQTHINRSIIDPCFYTSTMKNRIDTVDDVHSSDDDNCQNELTHSNRQVFCKSMSERWKNRIWVQWIAQCSELLWWMFSNIVDVMSHQMKFWNKRRKEKFTIFGILWSNRLIFYDCSKYDN